MIIFRLLKVGGAVPDVTREVIQNDNAEIQPYPSEGRRLSREMDENARSGFPQGQKPVLKGLDGRMKKLHIYRRLNTTKSNTNTSPPILPNRKPPKYALPACWRSGVLLAKPKMEAPIVAAS
jgi:hypothetical protein